MHDETATAFEIFRPGKRTALNGQTYEITEQDLRQTAEFYDPAVHEAPFVKGHPKTDEPAYGWVGGVEFTDGALRVTDRRQVEPAFADDVRSGRWKKRSASFWPPDHPANPTPGIWALKHVGFLGAAPPAVKGMPDVAGFAEDEDGIVCVTADVDGAEFADAMLAEDTATVFRRLREWVIERFSRDEADSLIPDFMIRDLERHAGTELDAPAYSDPETSDMDPTQQAGAQGAGKTKGDQFAEFAERENALAERERKLAEREQAAQAAEAQATQAETASFVDGLVDGGQVLPRDRDFLVEFMANLDNEAVEFADSEGNTTKVNRRDRFKQFLEKLPEQVDFSERAGDDGEDDAAPTAAFANPDRLPVDDGRADLHRKAKAYAAKHDVSFAEAARAVGG